MKTKGTAFWSTLSYFLLSLLFLTYILQFIQIFFFLSFNSSWPHFVSFNRLLTNVNNLSLVTLKVKTFNIAIIDQKTSTKKQTILENSKYYIKSQEVANVKVGREQDSEMVHKHGHGSCNEWIKKWFPWCTMNGQVMINTWFEEYARHL